MIYGRWQIKLVVVIYSVLSLLEHLAPSSNFNGQSCSFVESFAHVLTKSNIKFFHRIFIDCGILTYDLIQIKIC